MKNKQSIYDNLVLKTSELKRVIDETQFTFDTTKQLPRLEGIVGQTRGKAVMEFGLKVNQDGYHLYVSGISGTGKTSFTHSIVGEMAERPATLYDWCYVHNFENPYKPTVLQLPVGNGRKFQKHMEKLIQDLKRDLPIAFEDESTQKEKATIIRKFKEQRNKVYEEMNQVAEDYGFIIRQTNAGIMTMPTIDGEPISEEVYHNLPQDKLKEIDEKSTALQEKIVDETNKLQLIENEVQNEIEALEEKIATQIVSLHMKELRRKYTDASDVVAYLKALQTDVVQHVEHFFPEEQDEAQKLGEMLQGNPQKSVLKKYEVNLFIDNRKMEGAPVITADNCTYYNLVGKVEYENRMGVMTTDFTKIKPGFLHEANGGYIIIQVKDIFSKNFAWEGLKRALLNKELRIENLGEHSGLIATTSINPEPIPLDVKVILIGDMDMYQLLYQYDEDFRKLFKIRADFDVEMDLTDEHILKLAHFIHTHCEQNRLRHLDRSAVAEVVEYSIRLSGHKEKLSTRFNQLVEVIYEADAWAAMENMDVITRHFVRKAIEERAYRSSLYEEKIQESIEEGSVLIDVENAVIGQVNGLAVYNLGQYSFGKPSRITATTFIGQNGIMNIERESKMAGNIHNKGVYILGGYLGQTFAQKHPLALTAHLVFEQSYGGVDGDSASSTELYALLSSLAEVPIKQGLAVTGSVNQRGEIQPIGGVNEKIEGFFKVCQSKGLTGKQGVLIPHQNVRNLMLNEEVTEAVRNGTFHIYKVHTIEEGIELLTGVAAGEKDQQGNYEQETIFGKVAETLKQFAEKAQKEQDA